MSLLIHEVMSAQGSTLSAAQLIDKVAGGFGLISPGGASDSVVSPLVGSDTNAISSGPSPVTVPELVEGASDPPGTPAPLSSNSLPLTRLGSGCRKSILVSLLLSVAFLRFSLHPLYLRASRARRRS